MSEPTLSVALCTYNGGPFLQAQLESIGKQTLPPAEVVICDDGSTDNTLALVRQFAATACFPVRLSCNPTNLGSTKNFEQAVALCRGEIIALCDQDDVWVAHKLQTLVQALANQPNAAYVFSDMFDWPGDSLTGTYQTLWQLGRFDSSHFRQLPALEQVRDLLKFDRVTGTTMAFRATYKSYILPISPVWFHDGWIALLLTCLGYRGIPVAEPLLYYRRHAGQQTAIGREGLTQRVKRSRSVKYAAYMRQAQRFGDMRDRLDGLQAELPIKDYAEIRTLLTEKEGHLAARAALHSKPPWFRILPLMREFRTGSYHKYADTWPCVVKDLLF